MTSEEKWRVDIDDHGDNSTDLKKKYILEYHVHSILSVYVFEPKQIKQSLSAMNMKLSKFYFNFGLKAKSWPVKTDLMVLSYCTLKSCSRSSSKLR